MSDGLLVPGDLPFDPMYDAPGAAVAHKAASPVPPLSSAPYPQAPDPDDYYYDAGREDRSPRAFLVACAILCAACAVALAAVLVVFPLWRAQGGSGAGAQAGALAPEAQTPVGAPDAGEGAAPSAGGPAGDEGSVPTSTESPDQTDPEASTSTETYEGTGPEGEPTWGGLPSFREATASSTLPADEATSSYGPYCAVDGDTQTAWNEGVDGAGAGEWIRVSSDSERDVHGVALMGGYAKSESLYYKNNRPHLVSVSLSDGYACEFEMEDAFGQWQYVDFGGEHASDYVEVTIESVYEGTTWNDTSFTEVSVY